MKYIYCFLTVLLTINNQSFANTYIAHYLKNEHDHYLAQINTAHNITNEILIGKSHIKKISGL